MTRHDVKKLDAYQARKGELRLIEVPASRFLAIDGAGDPNTEVFARAVEALYPFAYTLKFASKTELGQDYVVPPLEGLWWAEDLSVFTTRRDKSLWSWTLLLLVPAWVPDDLVAAAREKVRAKGAPERLDDVRLESLDEGLCVQTLHVGSFDDEGPVLERIHSEYLPAQGLRPTGKHHEIYLSDFRRVEPARRRTILRQPVTR